VTKILQMTMGWGTERWQA